MRQYQEIVQRILDHGHRKDDRTGTGTLSVFGHQMRFNLADGFPLVTSKRTFWRGAFVEMLWFIRGDTNIKWLHQHSVHIWDEWADEYGDLGPIYGAQWRDAGGEFDQIAATQAAELFRQHGENAVSMINKAQEKKEGKVTKKDIVKQPRMTKQVQQAVRSNLDALTTRVSSASVDVSGNITLVLNADEAQELLELRNLLGLDQETDNDE